ncbi:MAG: hypothetical protein FWD96_07025 [Defluviitaleaceae bacterium]|nr:hypothetical protein [Defluviitaleaceae bacterium]
MTEETQLVIMLRDKASGFLEKEYAAVVLAEFGEMEPLLVNVFAEEEDGGNTLIHMRVSTAQDVSDWQYNAIYDYYDTEVFAEAATSVIEMEDVFNPTWELVFTAPHESELAATMFVLLNIHSRELAEVFEAIADKESEYTNE